ncbi:MAG: BPSS1780 family membrane protein [Sinimarinibacterium flocculans]|mgnify:CR=1 FL=1|uniref:Putative membrane protein n=1 Tax=Sinimarinibacterium flocculans TaxID=985250 RepID=A0A318EL88_9GAMM|nr:BPSS1780 family membrane protein [Sinimarinibacterium flocculans]PXV71604.1 putative membrane protein [Sinimarinibacterium flocculans]
MDETGIRSVGVDRASAWIGEGWALFKRAPGLWIAILVIYFVIAIVAGLIPVVGSLAFSLFAPVFTYGFLAGARDLDAGQALKIEHLFAGFSSPRLGSLVVLGVLSLVVGVGLALVAGFGLAGAFAGAADGGGGLLTLLVMLVVLLVMLVLIAALFFATPLVGFAGTGPVDAVKLSFAATIRNWLPLLVWGLIGLVLTFVGSIPFGLGLLVVVPLLTASYWCVCRDVLGVS